ncbi:hypothetical protein [Actinoplanes sp. NBRC 103695]|uniref:hypothetical protein n=1 Tax=Actinoplanes sp. NBRC 103695 TaxID=3032202 RepID=UPI0024A27036|nr:hypothetical protein [Actinoplanes sp. NBRC 103695]GLY96283.1 hypothetical protein Acsp02_35380 [Actinoplanes sp. NBRC 103695]
MTALVRMRLIAFAGSGRVVAPAILSLAVLGVLYGGGSSLAAPVYGYSATIFFPVLAWLVKLLLDTEPDVQRRLARIAVGPRRESLAGLLAATLAGLLLCAFAMAAPLLVGAIRGPEPGTTEPPLLTGILLGALAHLLALAAALALGALSSRVVAGTLSKGLMILVGGAILVIILGLSRSIAPWLVPPVMATARALNADTLPDAARVALLTAWTAAWCLITLTAYARLRTRRA